SMVIAAKLLKDQHIAQMFGANIFGALGIAKACAKRAVLADGGSIVFVSSVAGLRGRSGMTAYSAAKAAVDGMVRSLAAELAPRRVRVNSIAAGAVETEMHQAWVRSGVNLDGYRDLHLLGFGQPEDVANAGVFLLSDASPWITGAAIPVDGGYAAK
ncbi:MAG: SDR family oxidoreductase, partial [Gemmatimonadota bacterium]|nr:SDR family oxidoreductase [Gemmatimonadota bacterium]